VEQAFQTIAKNAMKEEEEYVTPNFLKYRPLRRG
jgi:hypothetical protein